MQFEVTKADSHKRTQNNSIDVLIPEELQVRVILKIDIETSVSVYLVKILIIKKCLFFYFRKWTNFTSNIFNNDGK